MVCSQVRQSRIEGRGSLGPLHHNEHVHLLSNIEKPPLPICLLPRDSEFAGWTVRLPPPPLSALRHAGGTVPRIPGPFSSGAGRELSRREVGTAQLESGCRGRRVAGITARGDAQPNFKFQRPCFAFCTGTFITSALSGIPSRPVHAQMPSRLSPKIPNPTWDAAAH